jgi:hypothetical protein
MCRSGKSVAQRGAATPIRPLWFVRSDRKNVLLDYCFTGKRAKAGYIERHKVTSVLALCAAMVTAAAGQELAPVCVRIAQGKHRWKDVVAVPKAEVDNLIELTDDDSIRRELWSGDSWSMLVVSIRTGRWNLASYLIGRGANVNQCTRYGISPLWALALAEPSPESLEVAEMLLANGADPNATPSHPLEFEFLGMTPLHLAVTRQNLALIKLLMANGADPGRTTAQGKTATSYLHEVLARRLEEKRLRVEYLSPFRFPPSPGHLMTEDELAIASECLKQKVLRSQEEQRSKPPTEDAGPSDGK